jgi:hypothetical protein
MANYVTNRWTVVGHLATRCLICGEFVEIESVHEAPKVCDKCKAAVMKMRSSMESEG